MAFYEDRVQHFGGALVLFKRNLAVAVPNAKSHRQPAWYIRLKIGGRKGYPICTKAAYTATEAHQAPWHPSSAHIGKRFKGVDALVAHSVYSRRTVGVYVVLLLLAAARGRGTVRAFLT